MDNNTEVIKLYDNLAQDIYVLVKECFSLAGVPQFGTFVFISNLLQKKQADGKLHMALTYVKDVNDTRKGLHGETIDIEELDMSRDIFNNPQPHGYYMTGSGDDHEPTQPTHPAIQDYSFHLAVSIFNQRKRPIGIISIHASRDKAFITDDRLILRSIADHVANKLEDIQNYEQQLQSMKILHDIDRNIIDVANDQAKDIDESREKIWKFILEKSAELTKADGGSIFRIQDKDEFQHDIIREHIYPDTPETKKRFPINKGFTIEKDYKTRLSVELAYLILTNQGEKIQYLIIKNRLLERPNHNSYVSALCVPIMGGDKLVGILTLIKHEENHFNPNYVALVQTLAGQAAVASVFAEQVDSFYKMVDMSHELSQKPFNEVLEIILGRAINEIFDPKGERHLIGTLRRVNIFTNTLDLVSCYPPITAQGSIWNTVAIRNYFDKNQQFPIETQDSSHTSAPKGNGLIGSVAVDCRRLWIENADHPDTSYVNMEGVKSIISVGIWGKKSTEWESFTNDAHEKRLEKQRKQKRHVVRGVISLMSPEVNGFTRTDLEILTYFANIISLVWAYHLQKERTEILIEIGKEWAGNHIHDMSDLNIWEKVQRIFTIGAKDDRPTEIIARGTFSEYRIDGNLIWKRANKDEKSWLPDYPDEIPIYDEHGHFSKAGVQAWVAYHNIHSISNRPDGRTIANIPNTTHPTGYLQVAPKENQSPDESPKAYILKQSHMSHPEDLDEIYHDDMRYPSSGLKTRSELCVPIIDKGESTDTNIQLRGLINIESPTFFAFDEDDEKIIEALARQIRNTLDRVDNQRSETSADYAYLLAGLIHEKRDVFKKAYEWLESQRNKILTGDSFERHLTVLKEFYAGLDTAREIRKAILEATTDNFQKQISLKDIINSAKIKARNRAQIDYDYDEKEITVVILQNGRPFEAREQDIFYADYPLYLNDYSEMLITLIFENLLCNAIQNKDQSRDLRITIYIEYLSSTKMLQVKVEDTGCGIKDDKLRNLFRLDDINRENTQIGFPSQPYFSSKGLGIGLHLTHQIMRKTFGGDIAVESAVGQGTTFTLWFPYPTQNIKKG
jgi:GAF domain-containing protein